MSRGQMLRGQMSPWQLDFVLNVHRNLPLKFHQNRVSNSWDIADIGFLWWGLKSHFLVKPNRCVEVRLGFWQLSKVWLNKTSILNLSFQGGVEVAQIYLPRCVWMAGKVVWTDSDNRASLSSTVTELSNCNWAWQKHQHQQLWYEQKQQQ